MPRHPLPALVLAFALLALVAPAAHAEEALVLDNGTILQGNVVREEGDVLQFKLSGVGTETRIEVRKDRIVKRFTTVDPSRPASYDALLPTESLPEKPIAAPPLPTPVEALPAEEPAPSEETFITRFLRLAGVAFPADVRSRSFLALLGLVVVLCLVAIGGRVADLEGMTLGKSTALALAFSAMVAANIVWADPLLRADHASWVIPLELVAWVALAVTLVRCSIGRAVMLLAFVVFTGSIVTFASGALLVTV